jgi:hypothetical protein
MTDPGAIKYPLHAELIESVFGECDHGLFEDAGIGGVDSLMSSASLASGHGWDLARSPFFNRCAGVDDAGGVPEYGDGDSAMWCPPSSRPQAGLAIGDKASCRPD